MKHRKYATTWDSLATQAAILYEDPKMSAVQVAEAMGISHWLTMRLIKSLGIQLRPTKTYIRKHPCDESFFDTIDTEAKAYWLGFIAADGYIQRYTLSIGLSDQDEAHLFRFRHILGSTAPVAHRPRPNNREAVVLSIASARLVESLSRHCIVQRKSLTLEWPDSSLPYELQRHFIRGFVDGDGGLYARFTSRGYTEFIFSVIAPTLFCMRLQSILMVACDLNRTKLIHSRTKGMDQIVYVGGAQVDRIFHYLYDESTIWLPRKRDRVEEELTTRPKLAGRQRTVLPMDSIIKRYLEGESPRSLAACFLTDRATIKRRLLEAGVPIRHTRYR